MVSKNGRLLLNFGPPKDGSMDPRDVAVLKAMAAWMRDNDECIHGTGLWRIQAEGPTQPAEGQFSDGEAVPYTREDFRFTCRGRDIYAICLKCPEDGAIRVKSLRDADASHLPVFNGIIESVSVLGGPAAPAWHRDEEALTVELGSYRSDMPVVVKVVCK